MLKIQKFGLVGLAPRRRRAGFTQESFAEELQINRSTLAMWEACRAWPSAAYLPKMADLLSCTVDDLYLELPDEDSVTEEALACHV